MAYNTNLNTKEFAELFNLPFIQRAPAYVIYEGDANINFDHDDVIKVDTGRFHRATGTPLLGSYRIWTREGLDAKYGKDDNHKGPEVGANAMGTMLTANKRPQEHFIGYTLGDTITIRSKQYRIESAPNDNIIFTAI